MCRKYKYSVGIIVNNATAFIGGILLITMLMIQIYIK